MIHFSSIIFTWEFINLFLQAALTALELFGSFCMSNLNFTLRIREVMTMDGTIRPNPSRLLPTTRNPFVLYDPLKLQFFDRCATHRPRLALQCVVNVDLHGSEDFRGVVEVETLDVGGCISNVWLANKVFVVGRLVTFSLAINRQSCH